MPESLIAGLGIAATTLLLYFIVVNLRHGSWASRPTPATATPGAALPVIISVFFALLQAWYLVIIQFLIAYLLIFTSLGRDIVALLLHHSAWYVGALTGIMLLLFALTMWLIPWHVLDERTYWEMRHKRAYLVVLRFLGLYTFIVFLLSIYAIDQDWQNFPAGMFWSALALAFVVYWILEISIAQTNIAPSLYWLLGLAFMGYVELSAADQHHAGFKWTTLLWAWIFWTITGPAPKLHREDAAKTTSGPATPQPKRRALGRFLLHGLQQHQSLQTWLGLTIGHLAAQLDRQTNPQHNIATEEPTLALYPKERLNAYRFYGNRFSYRVLFVVILALALSAVYLPNLEPISPIVFVYTGMGFLLILADYMYYTGRRVVAFATHPPHSSSARLNLLQKNLQKIHWYSVARAATRHNLNLYLYVFWVMAVLLLFFASNSNMAQYNLLAQKPSPARLTFHQYLDEWTAARQEVLANPATSSYPIFIFSGEGGGSRAGYWTASCLLGLDSLLDFQLPKHTLAISAVSGSAPGTVATLAWWERQARGDYQTFCSAIYQHNFISAGLAGNIFGATLRKFLRFFYFKNRNIRLCEEEAAAIEAALQTGKKAHHSVFSKLRFPGQFAWESFSGLYQTPQRRWRTDLPLFFPNSTHVQTGRRVLINPVINLSAEPRFINVIDLCQRMVDSTNAELALIQAANLSELFPFMSASAHIPKLGNYADASYCENYGLKTAYEIYQTCLDWKKRQGQHSLASKCQFYLVALMNTHPTFSANSPNLPLEQSIPSETLAPLIALSNVALSNNPFSVREEIKSVLPATAYHEMILNRSNLPLTRVLTKQNRHAMDEVRTRELKAFQQWYQQLRNE